MDDVEEFIDAVERVANGGTALDPEVVGRMLGRRRTEGLVGDALIRLPPPPSGRARLAPAV